VEILTDAYGGETTWELVEQGVGVIASGGPLPNDTLTTVDVDVCSTSCYDFTIFDSFGDGICCAYGNGFYNVYYEGNLVCSGGDFGASETCSDIACQGGGGGGLICVDGNDDFCGLQSGVEWCAKAGAEYLILVHGYSTGVGNFTLTVTDNGATCTPDVDCPAACQSDDECPEGFECIDGECVEIPMGACCQCDGSDQFCTIETEDDCLALEGMYLGDGSPCENAGGDVTYTSNPGAPIPDDVFPGLSDTITVTDSATVQDIKVAVTIDHTWLGDVCVLLSKDGGGESAIIKRMNLEAECDGEGCCGCSDDNMSVTLWDGAAAGIEDQCAAGLTGTYYSDAFSLSSFAGGDSAGDWTLHVNDNAGGDTGVLVSWSLILTGEASGGTPCEDAFPNQCLIDGDLDIKPGSCPNSYNNKGVGNGKLPVALVGSDEIDVTMVDLSSLLISRADGVGGFVAPLMGPPGPGISIEDTATPFDGDLCDCHEMMGDGIMDLNMKFHRTTMTNVMELGDVPGGAMVELVLTGSLMGGQPFEARDCIRIVPIGNGSMDSMPGDLQGGTPGWGSPGQ